MQHAGSAPFPAIVQLLITKAAVGADTGSSRFLLGKLLASAAPGAWGVHGGRWALSTYTFLQECFRTLKRGESRAAARQNHTVPQQAPLRSHSHAEFPCTDLRVIVPEPPLGFSHKVPSPRCRPQLSASTSPKQTERTQSHTINIYLDSINKEAIHYYSDPTEAVPTRCRGNRTR